MTSCAGMSPAGGAAGPLRAAEPKWAWFGANFAGLETRAIRLLSSADASGEQLRGCARKACVAGRCLGAK